MRSPPRSVSIAQPATERSAERTNPPAPRSFGVEQFYDNFTHIIRYRVEYLVPLRCSQPREKSLNLKIIQIVGVCAATTMLVLLFGQTAHAQAIPEQLEARLSPGELQLLRRVMSSLHLPYDDWRVTLRVTNPIRQAISATHWDLLKYMEIDPSKSYRYQVASTKFLIHGTNLMHARNRQASFDAPEDHSICVTAACVADEIRIRVEPKEASRYFDVVGCDDDNLSCLLISKSRWAKVRPYGHCDADWVELFWNKTEVLSMTFVKMQITSDSFVTLNIPLTTTPKMAAQVLAKGTFGVQAIQKVGDRLFTRVSSRFRAKDYFTLIDGRLDPVPDKSCALLRAEGRRLAAEGHQYEAFLDD